MRNINNGGGGQPLPPGIGGGGQPDTFQITGGGGLPPTIGGGGVPIFL